MLRPKLREAVSGLHAVPSQRAKLLKLFGCRSEGQPTKGSRHCVRNLSLCCRKVHTKFLLVTLIHRSVCRQTFLKREAAGSAEIYFPIYHISRCHIPHDSHRREILKIHSTRLYLLDIFSETVR